MCDKRFFVIVVAEIIYSMIKIRSDHLDGHEFGNFDADRISIDIGATNHMDDFSK
jgi:hypothetical protein